MRIAGGGWRRRETNGGSLFEGGGGDGGGRPKTVKGAMRVLGSLLKVLSLMTEEELTHPTPAVLLTTERIAELARRADVDETHIRLLVQQHHQMSTTNSSTDPSRQGGWGEGGITLSGLMSLCTPQFDTPAAPAHTHNTTTLTSTMHRDDPGAAAEDRHKCSTKKTKSVIFNCRCTRMLTFQNLCLGMPQVSFSRETSS